MILKNDRNHGTGYNEITVGAFPCSRARDHFRPKISPAANNMSRNWVYLIISRPALIFARRESISLRGNQHGDIKLFFGDREVERYK